MLTGTPLDLTFLRGLFEAAGLIYVALAVGMAGLVLWMPARWVFKLPIALIVLAAFAAPIVSQQREVRQRLDAHRAELNAATSRFDERCKTAGEKIHRTVDTVDGVVWLKWRPTGMNHGGQYQMDDPYGRDCGWESCILQLLRVTEGAPLNPRAATAQRGRYAFVETTDPRDGKRYRYVAHVARFWTDEELQRYRVREGKDPGEIAYEVQLRREPIERFSARYGITWDDISTREDREHWIAGGSLKVIDLQTQEVIAERVGYMMDRGLGSTAGFRSPWGYAHDWACPEPRRAPDGRAYRDLKTPTFVQRVLVPLTQ